MALVEAPKKSRLTALFAFLATCCCVDAQVAKRVVVIKLDGLPGWYVEKALAEKNPATGKSRAPWMEHIFERQGVRFLNFYTRGISLSVPSWQVLDTGQHTQIHGNAEFDRYTSHVYDYLNFIPFYINYSRGKLADMPSVQVSDEAGVPMLLDWFRRPERYQAFQLNQRAVRFRTLPRVLTTRLSGRPARQLMDEWQAGFSFGQGVYEEMERELLEKLEDPSVRYLDFFSGDFDHQGHLTMDKFSHAAVFEKLDRTVGRIFTAIQKSPLADETLLAVVSDHGMNTVDGIYSQGYNLIDYFTSASGGGHHVVTNRHAMQEYKVMGLDPMVYRVTTASDASVYLAGRHKQYPTVMLDLDGNERASVYFRNNHLNRLHMALLREKWDLALSIIDSQRERWSKALAELRVEIVRLDGKLARAISPEDVKTEDDRRAAAQIRWWGTTRTKYAEYAMSLEKVLALDRQMLTGKKFAIEELIPPGAMGERNGPGDLENYAVELREDGTFRTVDYLRALTELTTKNQPQKQVAKEPVDFVAMPELDDRSVLLYAAPNRRVRVSRDSKGMIRYEALDGWKPGLPLRILEDPEFHGGQEWLAEPHSEREWMRAVHRTRYSNGVIGILDHFEKPLTKQRDLARADVLIHANNHWNFNVRSFNPGGNHGSFFRISTHSVLMFWGGAKTGVGRGLRIEEPCDGLDFVPTVLEALGLKRDGLPGRALTLR
ncbi:hypothetical protein F183_A36470 [Bryobacterales bacterium F-183]|nr:hypothetical protein F183_A36470 [Bryobacterales bacterium F-183]